jgi:rare lipoprotein A (peptidoglycan hydrolase)
MKPMRILPGAMASLLLLGTHARAAEPAPDVVPPAHKSPHKSLHKTAARRLGVRRVGRAGEHAALAETGTASWYGPGFRGRRMASGRRFDAQSMVAAHAWLPLGARVRVWLVGTDRFVDVTITDRTGNRARVIDLSEGAARQLGILRSGTAEVVVSPL